MQAYGLYTHIRANRIKSTLLLIAFVLLLQAVIFSLLLLVEADGGGSAAAIMRRAWGDLAFGWPLAMLLTALWFTVAWFWHQGIVGYLTGAKPVGREQAPQFYNVLENLCISRGIPMPALRIIESDALNAFASGLKEGNYAIAVTRGLVETLTPAELEAVLAHELTHIRNRDTQLLVVALVFTGLFGFIAEVVLRGGRFGIGRSGSNSGSRKSGGGGAALIIIAALVVLALSWGLSVMVRLALSRRREYLADAGAVELTKNPDAMISALRKIETNAAIPNMSAHMSAFFIDSPLKAARSGALFSTHPTIDARVAALVRFAGGIEPVKA